ncbi:UDP-N-acetylmuramoyl-tripeptide--D-alanyl-D-alanine ligase [Paenibacillus eucommiae]|uniref:UDP-N-acetylmuramoyl-tripeptide--D-alanyl-D-alanine ligase n=1 Tax=Paenibacillus eucommiae TaxID=1355755 RepID=A0ABS4IYY1_9BACL|nr:UDP-N-acetylmuramoyl-tripeptide--D-alanyl-D-alanine ligase [Paenibacillus eucommiae]MBP1992798.1 UDP-N-acetylmuramoyl-tripeptide--D-alanyl-D-alanine ligase [Paenibacillus eucommiae]
MIHRSLQDIKKMLGSEAVDVSHTDPIQIHGVSTDTRTIQAGNLFIPLIGDHYDGHAYASEAHSLGAAAVLWQADRPNPPEGMPLILVGNTLKALQQLAQAYRRELDVRIIGITGSNGKTTTKDLVASVLSTRYQVHKTKGNLNNHIGLPLTLLQLAESTEFAVLEMGMSGRGEIALLSELAEPEAVIITMIGEAHMLQLGSREEIARAKTEIMSGLQPGGVLIYNGDEPLIEQVLTERADAKPFSRLTFGKAESNDIYPTEIELDPKGAHFRINSEHYPPLFIPLLGFHNVINALAAIHTAAYFGVNPEQIQAGFQALQMTSMRIEKLTAKSGLTVLNDAYNSSPAALRAALELVERLDDYSRKFIVLGDMLELGDQEEQYHREIGRTLSPLCIDEVYTFGRLAAFIAEEASTSFPPGRVRVFHDKQQLIQELQASLRPDDVVLIKGSRGMRLEQVANALLS